MCFIMFLYKFNMVLQINMVNVVVKYKFINVFNDKLKVK